jgi:hypothetical protein
LTSVKAVTGSMLRLFCSIARQAWIVWMPFFDRGRQASGRFTNDQQDVDNGIDRSAVCLEVRKGHQLDIAANLLDRFLHVCNKQQSITAPHGSARQRWSRVGIR